MATLAGRAHTGAARRGARRAGILPFVGTAVLSVAVSGCSTANVADPRDTAYFEGAVKAQKFTRESPDSPLGAVPAGVAPAGAFAPAAAGEVPAAPAIPAVSEAPAIPVAPVAVPVLAPAPEVAPGPPEAAPAPPAVQPGPMPGDTGPLAAAPIAPGDPVPDPVDGVPLPPVVPGPGDAAASEAAAVPSPNPPAVPRYNVIAQRQDDRPDKVVTYYVVIDPVDPTTDSFKAMVKQVIAALSSSNGGPMFSAVIWDRLSAAQTEVSFRSNPDLFSTEMLDAREAFNAQHLVAEYVGGVAVYGKPPSYQLLWFPKTRFEAPRLGQWVSAETWKP